MSELLHGLIQGLSKGEKRFFTLLHSHYMQERSSTLLQLFAAFDQGEMWDEQKFSKRNSGKKFLVHFAAEKQKLQHELLDTLVFYHRNSFLNLHIRQLFCQAEILFEKKRFVTGEKVLKKGLKMAKAGFLFELQLEGLKLLNEKMVSQNRIKGAFDILKERESIIQQLLENDEYTKLALQLIELGSDLRKLHADKKSAAAIELLLNHRLLNESASPFSPVAKLGFHSFWAHYAFIQMDIRKRSYHGTKIFELLLGHQLLIEGNLSQFFAAAANIISDAFALRDIKGLIRIRQQLSSQNNLVKKLSQTLKTSFESLTLLTIIYESLLNGDFARITSSEEKTHHIIRQLEHQQSVRAFHIGFIMSIALFAEKKYRKVIKLLNSLDLLPASERFEDRELLFRYFMLVSHFELRHDDTVEQQVHSIRRHARRLEQTLISEELVLEFFLQSTMLEGIKLKNKIRRLFEELKSLESDPTENIFQKFIYFILLHLRSKVSGKGFESEWANYIQAPSGKSKIIFF
ncbi:MAG: hypothetical protein ABIQ40_18215 [Bacteroidia bacterium]